MQDPLCCWLRACRSVTALLYQTKTRNVQTYVQWKVCHNQRKASCGGTAAFCRHDRWERQGTLECVHTVEAHTENRARGLLSLNLNSCHQLPRHCMLIEVCIVWYAYVGNCLPQCHMTVILLSVYVMGWNLVDFHNTTVCWWPFFYTPKWAVRI